MAGSLGSGRKGYHSGKWVVTFLRFGMIPLAATLTSTSWGPGLGTGISSTTKRPPISCRRAACIMDTGLSLDRGSGKEPTDPLLFFWLLRTLGGCGTRGARPLAGPGSAHKAIRLNSATRRLQRLQGEVRGLGVEVGAPGAGIDQRDRGVVALEIDHGTHGGTDIAIDRVGVGMELHEFPELALAVVGLAVVDARVLGVDVQHLLAVRVDRRGDGLDHVDFTHFVAVADDVPVRRVRVHHRVALGEALAALVPDIGPLLARGHRQDVALAQQPVLGIPAGTRVEYL